jgi:hypothetical protein
MNSVMVVDKTSIDAADKDSGAGIIGDNDLKTVCIKRPAADLIPYKYYTYAWLYSFRRNLDRLDCLTFLLVYFFAFC